MTSEQAFALWTAFDQQDWSDPNAAPYPCTKQADDPCQFIDTFDHSWGKCKACGYVIHDIPSSTGSDETHEALCCGTETCSVKKDDICVTHNN